MKSHREGALAAMRIPLWLVLGGGLSGCEVAYSCDDSFMQHSPICIEYVDQGSDHGWEEKARADCQGTWFAGFCPQDHVLGGCESQWIDGQETIMKTTWYYPDGRNQLNTTFDAMRLCSNNFRSP